MSKTSCKWCGKVYDGMKDRHAGGGYCSEKCKVAAKNAKKKK